MAGVKPARHGRFHFESVNFSAPRPGPRLIVTGAVHGNETCGTVAIRRVLDELRQGRLALVAGEATFVPVANPLAYALGQRQGERNLNRRLVPTGEPRDFEDRVANWLCPLLARHDVLLDLHSFQSAGEPFVMLGPLDNAGALEPFAHAAQEQALAVRLGVRRVVDGWLSTYAQGVQRRIDAHGGPGAQANAGADLDPDYGIGTTEHMRRCGGWGLTLECGQHADAHAPEVAYRAILNTLAHLGMIDAPPPAPAPSVEALSLRDVVDKAHAEDRFARPWVSFDALRAGDLIGTRHDGTPVRAPADGRIVFPNPAAQAGQEWFYLAQPSRRFGG
jgi:predicted deacylase